MEDFVHDSGSVRGAATSRAFIKAHAFRIFAAAFVPGLSAFVCGAFLADARQFAAPQTLDAKSPIPYFIAEGNGTPGYHSSDRELAQWALQDWQRSAADGVRFVAASSESTAIIRVYWGAPESGEYGETRSIVVGGQEGAAVFIRPDMDSLGPEIARKARADVLLRDSIVYLTCVHELGHALGLSHTRDFRDIMYFFGYGGDIAEYFGRYRAQIRARSDIAGVSGLSDGDIARIRMINGRN